MSFAEAVQYLLQGKKIGREGWNLPGDEWGRYLVVGDHGVIGAVNPNWSPYSAPWHVRIADLIALDWKVVE